VSTDHEERTATVSRRAVDRREARARRREGEQGAIEKERRAPYTLNPSTKGIARNEGPESKGTRGAQADAGLTRVQATVMKDAWREREEEERGEEILQARSLSSSLPPKHPSPPRPPSLPPSLPPPPPHTHPTPL
jgi:hypothetical protein